MRISRMPQAKFKSLHGFKAGVLLMLAFVAQVLSPTAFGQERNLDFYAPRNPEQKRTLTNVEQFHMAPARVGISNKQYGSALADLEFVLDYFSNHPQALVALSELCQAWRSPQCDRTAALRFQTAIERNPEVAQSHVVQALHFHRNAKVEEAVKSYKRAIELAPDSLNAHYNIGLAYFDLKQYDLANLHAQKSYALGVTLTALRTRLEKVGKWNTNVTLPAAEPKSASELPPSPEKSPEKPLEKPPE
jgi:tetratricopeptide (TPR) repeat protein